MTITKLHHAAYRCRDSEETRRFYEDFLGLPLVGALEIGTTKTGRRVSVLHTFYRMADGSQLAFFDAPDMPFEFKPQHDFDLHIALEIEPADLEGMLAKGRALGIEGRGVSDHGSIHSVYFRDPSGYVVELCARIRQPTYPAPPHEILQRWTRARSAEGQARSSLVAGLISTPTISRVQPTDDIALTRANSMTASSRASAALLASSR